jgi:hypothetical protein
MLHLGQISLWDTIVERKENATIAQLTRNKYSFVDQVGILNSTLILYYIMLGGRHALKQVKDNIQSSSFCGTLHPFRLITPRWVVNGFCDII